MSKLVEVLDGLKIDDGYFGDSREFGRADIMPGEVVERRDRRELPVGVPVHQLGGFFLNNLAGAKDLGACCVGPVITGAGASILSERANQKDRVVEEMGVDTASDLSRKVQENELVLFAAALDSLSIRHFAVSCLSRHSCVSPPIGFEVDDVESPLRKGDGNKSRKKYHGAHYACSALFCLEENGLHQSIGVMTGHKQ